MIKLHSGRIINENIIGLSDGKGDGYVMVYGDEQEPVTTMIDINKDSATQNDTPNAPYDIREVWYTSHVPVTDEERQEFARLMIERWIKWGGHAAQPSYTRVVP